MLKCPKCFNSFYSVHLCRVTMMFNFVDNINKKYVQFQLINFPTKKNFKN